MFIGESVVDSIVDSVVIVININIKCICKKWGIFIYCAILVGYV